jgi:uncharacterized membrane protein
MAGQLVVVGFEGVGGADRMLEIVNELQARDLLAITDAVLASRAPREFVDEVINLAPLAIAAGGQEVQIRQTRSQRGKFALRGGGAGLLVGLLLGGPVGGLVAGAALGAITGGLRDFGVSDAFVRAVSDQLKPDSSVLFLLVEASDPQAVLAALRPFQGRVLHTTLSAEQERRLQAALEREEH